MSKKIFFLTFFLFVFLSIFLYSPVVRAFFVSDDFDWIRRARDLPFSSIFFKNVNGTLENGVYRPLTSFSFWLNYHLHGLNPLFYHLTNIIFFGLTACLIFILVWQLTRDKFFSFLAGLFFLLLPNHPEAVAWISCRGDILAAFFYLLSLVLYLKFRQKKNDAVENRKINGFFLILSLASFLLALGAKEMAMTLPAILVVYELLWQRPAKKEIGSWLKWRFCQLAPFLIILFFYFWTRWLTTKTFYGFYANPNLQVDGRHYFLTLLATFFSNFTESSWGFKIGQIFLNDFIWLFLFLLALGLIFFFIIKKFRQSRIFLFGFFLLLVGLLPILSLSYSWHTPEGERFAYLPSVGFSVLLAVLAGCGLRVSRKFFRFFIAAVFLLLIVYFGHSLFQKNLDWRAAGDLSEDLVFNFGKSLDLGEKQGVVILGLPDTIRGAQVLRNGWPAAINLFYPNYVPDMLVAKIRYNMEGRDFMNQEVNWQSLADGFAAFGPARYFRGEARLESLDYLMTIGNYEKKYLSGDEVFFHFTPLFLKQMATKKIVFFRPWQNVFKEMEMAR